MSRPTVTLCMIVKDEEHIIHECLDTMKQYVDRFDITDTGSTDRTKEIIREWGEKNNIPGTVYDHPWEGFGKSRTASLRNAEKGGADYSWVIDADDRVAGNFVFPENFGEADTYALNIARGDFKWWRNQIFKNNVGWEYIGVIHEYADNPTLRESAGGFKAERIVGDYAIDARTMGNRTQAFGEDQQAKYRHDAETLLDCLNNPENPNYEPDNLRYKFYLAQSYFDAGDYEKAYEAYQKRAECGGWDEEVWYCIYRCGICSCIEPMISKNKDGWAVAQDHFLQAWNYRPTRIEPLYQMARIHRQNGNPRLGYMFAKSALGIQFPEGDILFLQKEMYDWMIYDEIAATAAQAGDMMLGLQCSMKLMQDNVFPEEHRERIENNYKHYQEWGHQKAKEEEAQKQAYDQAVEEVARNELEEKQKRIERQKKRVQEAKINKRRGKKAKVR
jgi:glycosyltransferase involved in cell wall biosynthesis